jgi:hypothetical protein
VLRALSRTTILDAAILRGLATPPFGSVGLVADFSTGFMKAGLIAVDASPGVIGDDLLIRTAAAVYRLSNKNGGVSSGNDP